MRKTTGQCQLTVYCSTKLKNNFRDYCYKNSLQQSETIRKLIIKEILRGARFK